MKLLLVDPISRREDPLPVLGNVVPLLEHPYVRRLLGDRVVVLPLGLECRNGTPLAGLSMELLNDPQLQSSAWIGVLAGEQGNISRAYQPYDPNGYRIPTFRAIKTVQETPVSARQPTEVKPLLSSASEAEVKRIIGVLKLEPSECPISLSTQDSSDDRSQGLTLKGWTKAELQSLKLRLVGFTFHQVGYREIPVHRRTDICFDDYALVI
ncbi:hypothetical protein BDZ91DRAFT_789603 [Kalaharituber pfeilii]|nr:hypothetical protein BDZ91DRAFT_789603 [Kalaharituber pfeilii]